MKDKTVCALAFFALLASGASLYASARVAKECYVPVVKRPPTSAVSRLL